MANRFFDLDQVRSIPILEVCSAYGIQVDRSKKCKIRDEKTPSVQLYTKNSSGYDRFWDFGINEGGDVIAFVAKIKGSDWQSALEDLADTFGIEPMNNTDYINRSDLTDSQYLKIGIYGDLATKNLDFDLERFSLESAQKYADKYHMNVNELRRQYPDFYVHKILRARALPYVSDMRNDYYSELYNHYLLAKSLGVEKPEQLHESFLEKFTEKQKALELAERLLHKAAKGTSMEHRLPMQYYDVEKDYDALIEGKISFQIGSVSYFELKEHARKNDDVLLYKSVSFEDYNKLVFELLKDVPHAAFVQGSAVNIVHLPEYEEVVLRCIDAIPVHHAVEAELANSMDESETKNVVIEPMGMER